MARRHLIDQDGARALDIRISRLVAAQEVACRDLRSAVASLRQLQAAYGLVRSGAASPAAAGGTSTPGARPVAAAATSATAAGTVGAVGAPASPLSARLNRALEATLGASLLAAVDEGVEAAAAKDSADAGSSSFNFGRATVAECVARAASRESSLSGGAGGGDSSPSNGHQRKLPAALIGGEQSAAAGLMSGGASYENDGDATSPTAPDTARHQPSWVAAERSAGADDYECRDDQTSDGGLMSERSGWSRGTNGKLKEKKGVFGFFKRSGRKSAASGAAC